MPESEVPQKLQEWLRGVEAADCVRVEVRHMVAGAEGGGVVATFELEGEPARFNPEAIYDKIAADAEGIGGLQRYTIVAFKGSSKAARDTLRLRVDGGADAEVGGGTSEPANLRGLVAQLMRHNETNMRMVRELAGTVPEAMTKLMRVITEALEKGFEEKVEHWRVMSQQAQSDRDGAEQQHRFALERQRLEVLAGEVRLLTPGLLSKLGLGSAELTETAMTRLIESLSEKQREVIFSALTPDQCVALGAVIDRAVKKDAKERGEGEGSQPAQKGSSNGQA